MAELTSTEFDLARERLDTSKGRAILYNIQRLKKLGYDVDSLPYSIRVLLENELRFSGKVPGATEAARALANWPNSVGAEMPFMPYRVLLQDYTGVPLVVDLAAMRDAARKKGLDPKSVNSSVPVDLVIDHSVQVDRWSSDVAPGFNLEKEYERNSERYSLLKWAQSSFKGMRVFPPGTGICHQVNLEFLSKVVVSREQGGELRCFPDTLVGTDSHTTMVNGLGVLGWGVGGIEAEAVLLGEPYHMPVPKVLGVKLTGSLREGVTPTDLVLTITEKLREKNVVGAFVEYFGDGYLELSVPDRATIGNMSPEYGATVGFSPVDEATLAYLAGTGRDGQHVQLVRKYCITQGLMMTPSTPEPRYSEVMEFDLDRIEPSVAGPRNPDERRSLKLLPSFTRTLLDEYSRGAKRTPESSVIADDGYNFASGVGQVLKQTKGGTKPDLLGDGSVVIAAITSCTNTSNPTVMVGAGLLAKKAVELGLKPKAHVKRSLAPGSTVVTDYLQNSGLLTYLDRLGFNIVGYGCTTCIAEGTPVLLADGTTRPIESLPPAGATLVFGPTAKGRLGIARQSDLMKNGMRDCVELVLQDGRSLICTPDHRILSSSGRWVRADELLTGKDRVIVGLEGPLDKPGDDESGYALHAGNLTFSMDTPVDRARTLAFARLLGHLHNDGSISVLGQGRMNVGQAVDREMVLNDVELLTELRPAASRYDERKWTIALPMSLVRAIVALPGVQVGRRINQPPTLPAFVCQKDCPVAVAREFLGGLFGADGHAPALHRWGQLEDDSTIELPAYSQSTIPAHVEQTMEMMRQVIHLLTRCGVQTEGARIYEYPTRRSSSSYSPAQDGIPRVETRLDLPNGLSFIENVGFRYSVDKAMRGSAAAVYWRLVDGIQRQRLWMASRLDALHQDQPALSFSQARQLVAVSLLGHESEESLPPVVSSHYALLEGSDRFSRVPKATDRRFQPMHRESCDFPSPVTLFKELGVRDWFAPLQRRGRMERKRYCVEEESVTLPTFSLQLVARHPVGQRPVYDVTVGVLHAFVAGTVAVHNCIGNSGPLAPEIEREIKERDLYAVAVLSGNRNFDGRIHPLVKGSFLMSPMLVVAFALAGRIDYDFLNTPLGAGKDGKLAYLRDVWPTMREIKAAIESSLKPEFYKNRYANPATGDERWKSLRSSSDDVYSWASDSTYIRRPPWFEAEQMRSGKQDILGARAIALLEDKVTTDHISPAGAIAVDSPAAEYLQENGVEMIRFSTYGSRRGNHEVMVRGGFSNIRLKNLLASGKEGDWTTHYPSGQQISIYEAAVRYRSDGVPLIVLAGKMYGAGSSRDWAAKAPKLLGVRAVIAETYERIHRSNLAAMGVLPLEFEEGQNCESLGLSGTEIFDIMGPSRMVKPKEWVEVVARGGGREKKFKALVRIDNVVEMEYVENGGVLPFVFNKMTTKSSTQQF